MEYSEKTNDAVKTELKEICRTSQSEDEVKRRIKDELGYPYDSIAVTSTSTSSGPMTMIMFMVMIIGPDGNTISI